MYVESLARQQQGHGIEAVIAAPGRRQETYRHCGLAVRRFPVAEEVRDIRELYGEGDALAAAGFATILERERPDLVHLHAFTRGVSLRLVREAKRRRIPLIFTFHTPTVSCQRGTLLRWGSDVCDGRLDPAVCSACTLDGLGLNRYVSRAVASLPSGVGRIVRSVGLSGGPWTAVRMTELVTLRHAAFRDLMTEVDHIVALREWVKDVLLCNGVPADKITVSRQGLWQSEDNSAPSPARTSGNGPGLRMMFLGRLHPTKGVHLLIDTLKATPDIPATLDIYGVIQGDAAAAYLRRLKQMASGDDRIRFRNPIPTDEVVSRMRDYDVLAVPSQLFETGPMVILEAFAAGLPVIASNLGGIAELVTHEVNGLLVKPRSTDAWRHALERLSRDHDLLNTLRERIRRPRCISEAAADMSRVYADVLADGRVDSRRPPTSNLRSDRQVKTSAARL